MYEGICLDWRCFKVAQRVLKGTKTAYPMSRRWRMISRMIFSINPKALHRLTSTSFCFRRSLKIKPRMRFAKRKRFVSMPYSRCAILCKKIRELWWLDWTESSCCGSCDFASLAYRWQWKVIWINWMTSYGLWDSKSFPFQHWSDGWWLKVEIMDGHGLRIST